MDEVPRMGSLGVTKADDPTSDAVLTEGRATFNLNAGSYSAEQVQAAHKWAPLLGMAPEAVADLDNQELHAPWTAEGLPAKVQTFLGWVSPFQAAGYRNALPEMGEAAKTLTDGLDPADIRSVIYTDRPLTFKETVARSKEWDKLRKQRAETNERVSAVYAMGSQAEREKAISALKRNEKRVAVLLTLSQEYPDWQSLSDGELSRFITQIGEERGVDLSDIKPEDLRKRGVSDLHWGEELGNALDLFGIVTARRFNRTVFSMERMARTDERSPLADLQEKNELLESMADDLTGWSWDAKLISGFAQTLPFMAEFWLTGPLAVEAHAAAGAAKGAVKLTAKQAIELILRRGGFLLGKEAAKNAGFWKKVGTVTGAAFTKRGWEAIGKAAGTVLKAEAMKTPLYIPQATAEGYNEWLNAGRPLYYLSEDGVQMQVPDRYADELAPIITRELLRGYIARVSEYGGEFLPDIPLPKGMRKGVTQMFLNYLSKDTIARNMFARRFAQNAPIGGILSEYLEEKWNDVLDYAFTSVAEATGLDFMNMGQTSLWNSWEDELLTLATVGAMSGTHGVMVRGAPNLRGLAQVKAESARFRESVAKLTAVNAKINSEPLVKDFVGYVHPQGRTLYVTPEDGLVFYQTAPEMAQNLGITPEAIDTAKERKGLVPVNENALLLESAKGETERKNGEMLFSNTLAASGHAVGEVLKGDVGQIAGEMREKYLERKKLVDEYMKKLNAVVAVANAGFLPPGVSKEAFRAELRLFGMTLATLSVENDNEKAREIIDKAFSKLTFGFPGGAVSVEEPAKAKPAEKPAATEKPVNLLEPKPAEAKPAEEFKLTPEPAPAQPAKPAVRPKPVAIRSIEAAGESLKVPSVEEKVRNGTSTEVENAISIKGGEGVAAIRSVPVSDLNIDPKRFQFKSKANKITGVDESNQIGGEWDPVAGGILYVWEDKDGKLFVVNGHHRFALAKEKGVKNVNVVIDREADGVTAAEARKKGTLLNIKDEKGSVEDYAEFARMSGMSEAEAEREGLLSRGKGRMGFRIGAYASDNLYGMFQRGEITAAKAELIAVGSLHDKGVEAAGIKAAEKMSAEQLREFLRCLNSIPRVEMEQGNLFGFDDTALLTAEKLSALAAKHIAELRKGLRATGSAVRNPEAAAKGDVHVGENAKQIRNDLAEELRRWEHWYTDKELYNQLVKEAGLTPEEVASVTRTNTETKAESGRFNMDSQTPLLTPEEDAGDFKLTPESPKEAAARDRAAEREKEAKRERADKEAEKNVPDLFGEEAQPGAEKEEKAAGLTEEEQHLLELADRFRMEDGTPDFKEMRKQLNAERAKTGGKLFVFSSKVKDRYEKARAKLGKSQSDGASDVSPEAAKEEKPAGKYDELNRKILEALSEEDELTRNTKLTEALADTVKSKAHAAAGKFAGTSVDEEELRQLASVKVLNAAKTFDAEKAKGKPYAYFAAAINSAFNSELRRVQQWDAQNVSADAQIDERAEEALSLLDVISNMFATDNQWEIDEWLAEAEKMADLKRAEKLVYQLAKQFPKQTGSSGVPDYKAMTDYINQQRVKAGKKPTSPENVERAYVKARSKVRAALDELKRTEYYQLNPVSGVKGKTRWYNAKEGELPFSSDTSMDAMITLFATADASTLPHEIAHWTKELMGALVREGVASERTVADWNALEQWLDRQKYEHAPGTPEYQTERAEKFARAFEAYLQTGRAPTLETQSAFYTLRRLISAVYNYAKDYLSRAFGFELSDDIVQVFDHLLGSAYTMQEQSPLQEAMDTLKDTFGSLLGLSQKEADDFRRLAELAHAETVNALEKRKQRLLPGLRAQWRAEAQEMMNDMDVYKLWGDIAQGGGLDTALLDEAFFGYDKKAWRLLMRKLRHSGLISKEGGGMDAAMLANKYGYANIRDMVDELYGTPTPKDFIKNYMAQMEQVFHDTMEIDGTELTEKGMLDLLDSLMEKLAATGGGREGWKARKAQLMASIDEELSKMNVRDVMNEGWLLRDLRRDARDLTAAMGKKDFAKALELAIGIRKNLVLLGEKGKAAQRVERTKRLMRRGVKAKDGVIYKDYGDALKELAYFFGFTDSAPKGDPGARSRAANAKGGAAAEVFKGTDDSEKQEDLADTWGAFLFTENRTDYRNLSLADFEHLADFADYLDGVGRDLTNQAKNSFHAQWTGMLGECLESLKAWGEEGKYHDRKEEKSKTGHWWRIGMLLGRNLRTFMAMADKFAHIKGAPGGNLKLYERMSEDASDNVALYTRTVDRIRPYVDALARLRKEKKIKLPAGVTFEGNGLKHGYSEWTENRVIAACLNMGNAKNLSRLVDGFGWKDEQLAQIRECLPEEGWQAIQGIWDVISGELQERASETFLAERHYRMRLEKAQSFVTKTADGKEIELRGGYYPIYYTWRPKHGEAKVDEGGRIPTFGRISATEARASGPTGGVVSLDLANLDRHIVEVSHYAATRIGCRMVMNVLMSKDYRDAFGSRLSYEAYDEMMKLARNLANPAEELKAHTKTVITGARTCLAAGALMVNARSIGMQLNSLTVGADELGEHYVTALAEVASHLLEAVDNVREKSAFMRHRSAYWNIDAAETLRAIDEGAWSKFQKKTAVVGYWCMKGLDMRVASVGWIAKYNQTMAQLRAEAEGNLTMDEEEMEKKAVAAADGFVARTQGANRALELNTMQLSEVGKMLTPFLTAANAQYNTMLERWLLPKVHGVTSFSEMVGPLLANLIMPMVLAGAVGALLPRGSDDDKKLDPWTRRGYAFLREILTNPLSGVPIVRDVWEAFVGAALAKMKGRSVSFQGDILAARELEEFSKVLKNFWQTGEAIFDGNMARALYKASEAVGWLFQVPVIQVYARTKRLLISFDMELPEWMQEIEDAVRKQPKGGDYQWQ